MKFVCDKYPDCGIDDNSDENNCNGKLYLFNIIIIIICLRLWKRSLCNYINTFNDINKTNNHLAHHSISFTLEIHILAWDRHKKVIQWFATDMSVVFFGYTVSSTNKADHHYITGIFLKVALNTITLALHLNSR